MELLVYPKVVIVENHSSAGEPYNNGDLFEVYVRRLFKRSDFDLLYETKRDPADSRKTNLEKKPDFQMLHKRSGHSFWIKCRYNGDNDGHELDWCDPDQLACYKQFQEDVWPEQFYMVIGYGGRPMKPSALICIPLDKTEHCEIEPKALELYKRDPSRPFDCQKGHLA